jgi:hypothetical protein
MKPLQKVLILAAFLGTGIAAPRPVEGRTLTDINVIPTRVLQRSISPKFYKSLLISPIQGRVVVRASLSGTSLTGMRVIYSEPKGLHDHLALQRAKDVQIAGNYSIERPNTQSSVLVHLLIYQIADGTMALSFAHLDEPGGNQMEYYGCARLAVLKNDGKWTEIKGPEGLEGKGWAVRRGIKNNLSTSLKLERLTTGAEATNMSHSHDR